MSNRRAQGISVNVIIIAAIALVVMVILIALVFNSAGTINPSANSCEGLGEDRVDYRCIDPSFSSCSDFNMVPNPARGCQASTPDFPLTCCIKI